MQRFIDAALLLIEQRPWDAVAVSDLVRQAGSSVGSFYARFTDKETLLAVLDDYYADTLCAELDAFAESPASTTVDSASDLLGTLVTFHQRHRGLIRTLVLAARSSVEDPYAANTARINARLPAVLRRFLACTDLPAGCSEQAIREALVFTYSAMREQLLFPESVPGKPLRPRALVRTLSTAFVGMVRELSRG